MTACVSDVALWVQSNWLQLNTVKTALLQCSYRSQSDRITSYQYMTSVHWLRHFRHVSFSSCFAVLRYKCSIKQSISILQSLVVSMVTELWLVFHAVWWTDLSRCSTRQHGWCIQQGCINHITLLFHELATLLRVNSLLPGSVCVLMPALFSAIVSFRQTS